MNKEWNDIGDDQGVDMFDFVGGGSSNIGSTEEVISNGFTGA